MKVCALASGSSGNCFYVEDDKTAILVDVGISAKRVVERMTMLNLKIDKVKGIFVTHEHSDHIIGIDVLARRFNIPIFATRGTISRGFLCSTEGIINRIESDEIVILGKLQVEAFSKSHSAAEPISFSIKSNNKIASVITDAGYACDNINNRISQSDFLFIESNHDMKMLEIGPYAPYLKRWITSDKGHLSNSQASLAVLENGSKKLKNIVLSHISKTNNTPEVALQTFKNTLKERSDLSATISASVDASPTQLFPV